jgi:two-component system, NarL family, response regulator LiaR
MGNNDHRPITVVIVDDDDIFRHGLEGVLIDTDIEIVGVYGDHEECLRQIVDQPPQVVLIDLHFYNWKRDGGIDLIRQIKRLSPSTKCIVLTAVDPDGNLVPDAYFAGAHGYLRKGHTSGAHLPDMIKTVASDQYVFDAELAQAILFRLESVNASNPWQRGRSEVHLTEREKEILHLVARGLENGKIAEELVIGVSTVKTHIQNILKKLQFHDREQAAVYFVMKNSSRSENARKDEE